MSKLLSTLLICGMFGWQPDSHEMLRSCQQSLALALHAGATYTIQKDIQWITWKAMLVRLRIGLTSEANKAHVVERVQ